MIAIIDYKGGNLTSVQMALSEVGEESVITASPDEIFAADRVVFPGVGAAGAAMEEITRLNLAPVLRQYLDSGRPFLGICVGCQIILEWSLEDDRTPCLGFLPGGTGVFAPSADCKVPHMGWNQVNFVREHPVLAGIPSGSEFYFVHSYFPKPGSDHVIGETGYAGVVFPSIIGKDNLVACQFHAEKSGPVGLRLLKNFASWNGRVDANTDEVARSGGTF